MRVLITRLLIQHVTLGQDLLILTRMTLCRGHEADTPVSVLMFIPADEMAPNSGVHPDLQSHPQAITDNISRF